MICPYSVYIKNIYTLDIIYHILKFVHPRTRISLESFDRVSGYYRMIRFIVLLLIPY